MYYSVNFKEKRILVLLADQWRSYLIKDTIKYLFNGVQWNKKSIRWMKVQEDENNQAGPTRGTGGSKSLQVEKSNTSNQVWKFNEKVR